MLKSKVKSQKSKVKITIQNLKFLILICNLAFLIFNFKLASFAQEEFKYDAQGKRNPFIPLVTSDGRLLKLEDTGVSSGLSVEGIIYDKLGISYAIINGDIVKIGDTVGEYQVLKIEQKKVIFIKNGELTEVELKEEES